MITEGSEHFYGHKKKCFFFFRIQALHWNYYQLQGYTIHSCIALPLFAINCQGYDIELHNDFQIPTFRSSWCVLMTRT